MISIVWRTTGIPMKFNSGPEPKDNVIASTIPMPAAKAKDVDTAGRYFFPPVGSNKNPKSFFPTK